MVNLIRKTGGICRLRHPSKSRSRSMQLSNTHERKSLRQEFVELGIPGFDHFFNNETSAGKRFMWGLLCIIISVGCLVQCIERIAYFMNGYPAVRTSYDHVENISFPCITICPTNEFSTHPAVWRALLDNISNNATNYSNVYELMKGTNLNVSTLWNISRLPIEEYNASLSEGASLSSGHRMSTENLEKKYLPTTAGTCVTVRTKNVIPHRGRLTYMAFEGQGDSSGMDNSMRFRYLYHMEEDTALIQYIVPFEGLHSPYSVTQYNILRMEKLTYLNTWRYPCDDDPLKVVACKVQCLQREIFSRTKTRCKLPYMQDMTDHKLPDCVSPEEFQEVYEATSDVLNAHHEHRCGCLRKCQEMKYYLECITGRNDTNSLLRLLIFLPENQMGIIEEIDAYSFAALFSDIGGSMGLFLGICTVQVCEIGGIILRRLFGCLKSSRVPRSGQNNLPLTVAN